MREADFSRLLKVLHCEKVNEPVLFEFLLNEMLRNRLAGRALPKKSSEKDRFAHGAAAFAAAGYDYVIASPGFQFTHHFEQTGEKSISQNEGVQITDWESFKAYPWPDPGAADYSILKEAEAMLPGKMKIVLPAPYGILENITSFFGYDNLAYLVYDDPALLKAASDMVGERLLEYYRLCLAYDSVGAILYNDDWGFNTGLMYSLDFYEENIFPWVRKMTALAHQNGRAAIIHSCGRLDKMMDIIIDDLKFDGKHSFEDKIEPIEKAYKKYKGRIALLGGLDVDYMCRSSKEEIYRRSKAMLESGETGYALGTGNSVPAYIPMENYFAMISAAELAPGNRC
jgi:uroporphyrinogen decarboxylase